MASVSPAPLRPCAARAALRELRPLLHLFRASYVCAIAWSALFFWLEIGSRLPCAWLGFSFAVETVRRPRGASRASPLLHLFSGQLCLWDCLDRLVGLAGDWVRASMCMPWFFRRPCDRAPPARRFASKLCSYICFGPVMSGGLPGPPCWFALGLGQGRQVHGLGFYSALETVRRPRGASRASPVPHLFRASYVWAIAWSALMSAWRLGQGLHVHASVFSGALETVRRPRGASRHKSVAHPFQAGTAV